MSPCSAVEIPLIIFNLGFFLSLLCIPCIATYGYVRGCTGYSVRIIKSIVFLFVRVRVDYVRVIVRSEVLSVCQSQVSVNCTYIVVDSQVDRYR